MSHFNTKFLFLFSSVFITACGGGGGSDDSGSSGTATSGVPSIQYQTAAISFIANTSNTPVSPSNSGGPITSCVASPALPANLVLDQTSCSISGAPRGAFSLANFTITATGPDGAASASVAISASLPAETFAGSINTFWGTSGLSVVIYAGLTVRAQVAQSDGKLLVLGDTGTQLNIFRLDSFGNLDTTFGGTGIIAYSCSNFGSANCKSLNFLMQPDGKLVVTGVIGSAGDGLFAFRMNADGSGDSSFGTGGVALVIFSSAVDTAYAGTLLDPDTGNLILASTAGASHIPVAARILPNGTLDSTFGTAGQMTYSSAPGDFVRSIGYDMNSKKYYLGASTASGGALLRLNSNGGLDSSFGSSGVASFSDLNFTGQANESIALQYADGDILFGAGSHVLRYTISGAIDSSFGTSGVVTLVSSAASIQLLVQPNEKILVTAGISASKTISVTRYNSNGSKDSSFGTAGSYSPLHSLYGDLLSPNLMLDASTGLYSLLAQGSAFGTGIYTFLLD